MKNIFIAIIALFAFHCSTVANGDPTDQLSALYASSNPTPRDIVDIQIISEKLFIRPGNYSNIHVKYLLYNTSDKDYLDIDYGFPVDYVGEGMGREADDCCSESNYVVGWFDDYIREISFMADGKMIPYKMSEEVKLYEPPVMDRSNYEEGPNGDEDFWRDEEERDLQFRSRRWFYTKFSIKAGESMTLEVKYSVRNSQSRPVYGEYFNMAGNNCYLDYDFSPAVHWGNGHALDFYIEIDTSSVCLGLRDTDWTYNNEGMSRLVFDEYGDKLIYTARNFPFKDAKPLCIQYSPKNHYDLSKIMKFRIPNTAYTIIGNEVKRNYPLSYINDMDLNTTWVSSLDNPKLTITFDEPTSFYGIYILGAYYKNEDTYTENNRVKSITMKLKGLQKEYIDSVEVYNDFEEIHQIWIDKDFEYMPLYFEDFPSKCMSYMRGRFNYKIKVKKIELDITGVFPGSKYRDTCISEIILLKDPY